MLTQSLSHLAWIDNNEEAIRKLEAILGFSAANLLKQRTHLDELSIILNSHGLPKLAQKIDGEGLFA